MVHTNFATLKAFLHLSHTQDLIDDVHVRRVLQAPLGVAGDLPELVGSNSVSSKLADNV